MSLVGTGSPTSKTLKRRCSSASRRISRSGLIRELNEMRSQLQKSGKRSAARPGGCKAGREGGVGKCSHHRRSDDVNICVVAIFGCHLKDKGNKISRHLLPRA